MPGTSARSFRTVIIAVVFALVCSLATGCSHRLWNTRQAPAQRFGDVDASASFVRCHMRDGSLYVLKDWAVDAQQRVVRGSGTRHNADRTTTERTSTPVPMDEIVLLQSVQPVVVNARKSVIVLASLSIVSAVILALCLTTNGRCVADPPVAQ